MLPFTVNRAVIKGHEPTIIILQYFAIAGVRREHAYSLKSAVLKVQNYNAVLTLSHLYQTADAILTLDNDSLHQICARLMNIKNVSFRFEACLQSNVGTDLKPISNVRLCSGRCGLHSDRCGLHSGRCNCCRDINAVVAQKMASVLQPCFARGEGRINRNHVGE